ncbi:hypothetical protein IGI04_008592 [Brassica rapa subsp. trilocularis]|uniref:Uncharacterized protein n=1 Tax=Brassica rapa subsp. trilocularis TaxID=1813537 RepID=A0ABQ7NNB6_BRACM|nr:hypothetical protein IGI04_008592 [Brassica rapa subsp. trilocularis]
MYMRDKPLIYNSKHNNPTADIANRGRRRNHRSSVTTPTSEEVQESSLSASSGPRERCCSYESPLMSRKIEGLILLPTTD